MKNVCILAFLFGLKTSIVYADGIVAMYLFTTPSETSETNLFRVFFQHAFHKDNPQLKLYQSLYGPNIQRYADKEMEGFAKDHALTLLQAGEAGMDKFFKVPDRLLTGNVSVYMWMQKIGVRTFLTVGLADGIVVGPEVVKLMKKLILDGNNSLDLSKVLKKDIQLRLSDNYLIYEDKLEKIQKKLDEIKDTMKENIEYTLKRGEKIEVTLEKTEGLVIGSIRFNEKARKQNSCCP